MKKANKNQKKKGNWKKQKRQQAVFLRNMMFLSGAVAVILFAVILHRLYINRQNALEGKKRGRVLEASEGKIPRPELDVDLLTVNEYSRPGTPLEKIRGVVIHYTANPGTGARANRNYFEGLKDSHVTKASSHFVVGLDGEIVQCIPSSEIAYASNERNQDTIAIECCIEDDTGRFNEKTYHAVVHLTAWLVEHFGLRTEDVIRHYDVTGKPCPKYFVDFPSAWEQFLADVQDYLVAYGVF
ncbi:MAG: N-acetylmuramoyl-L-alanine amidase [Eubacterium sp.]|nr:N-acetylmuramoyl-L-alanine amidase [Eubacterium sp.]